LRGEIKIQFGITKFTNAQVLIGSLSLSSFFGYFLQVEISQKVLTRLFETIMAKTLRSFRQNYISSKPRYGPSIFGLHNWATRRGLARRKRNVDMSSSGFSSGKKVSVLIFSSLYRCQQTSFPFKDELTTKWENDAS
jgi:hypothetical protein